MQNSIVVNSFNRAEFLHATLRAPAEQGHAANETLLMEGVSPDGSVDIIRRYADRFGFLVTRSYGKHSQANGKLRCLVVLVGWLNSDEVHMPGTLSSLATAARSAGKIGQALLRKNLIVLKQCRLTT